MQAENERQNDYCRGCSEADSCRDAYKRAGNSKGPPVTKKVVTALLLPLLIFIISVAGSQAVFSRLTDSKITATIISICVSLAVTFISAMIIKAAVRRFSKDRQV